MERGPSRSAGPSVARSSELRPEERAARAPPRAAQLGAERGCASGAPGVWMPQKRCTFDMSEEGILLTQALLADSLVPEQQQ